MKDKNADFDKLDRMQKVNFVKNLLFNHEINEALDTLLKNEKKDLNTIKIILEVLNEELIINRIKQECNLNGEKNAKLFVYSKILGILSFYKKTVILNSFLKSFSEEERKEIAMYEYQNKTAVSLDNKTFNKYCLKYKTEALKELEPSKEETLMLTMEMNRYNLISSYKKANKKNKTLRLIVGLICIVIFCFFGYGLYSNYKLVNSYEGLFYPGIYLNDTDLSGMKITDLKNVIDNEEERIKNGAVTVTNPNGEFKFTYDDIGIKVSTDNLEDEIIKYNEKLPFFKKVSMIKNKKKEKTFYIKTMYDDNTVDDFMNLLEEKLNTTAKNDGMVVDENHNAYYDKGLKGFTLDVAKTKNRLEDALKNLREETVIEAEGEVIENEVKYGTLASINKKVSTYTTYFLNAGNRGHNISLASRRLNGTVLMPGDEFSYLKVVGPYGSSNGYLPAPIYLNGESATANGGGVCQLASTLYMAQLKAGLETVARRNHTFAPNYVPKGLDATVYSTTTDYKFKNNYEYPIYITSYVSGNYLTVDIWTNDAALGGKTFEPYSVYSNGVYLSYLKTIENGKVIDTKYLDKSVYKTKN